MIWNWTRPDNLKKLEKGQPLKLYRDEKVNDVF
jgi:predicted transcriptional regulator